MAISAECLPNTGISQSFSRERSHVTKSLRSAASVGRQILSKAIIIAPALATACGAAGGNGIPTNEVQIPTPARVATLDPRCNINNLPVNSSDSPFPTGLSRDQFPEKVLGDRYEDWIYYSESMNLIQTAKIYKRLWRNVPLTNANIPKSFQDNFMNNTELMEMVIKIVEGASGPIEGCGDEVIKNIDSPILKKIVDKMKADIWGKSSTYSTQTMAVQPFIDNPELNPNHLSQIEIDAMGEKKIQEAIEYMLKSNDPDLVNYAKAALDLQAGNVPDSLNFYGCSIYNPFPMPIDVSDENSNTGGVLFASRSSIRWNDASGKFSFGLSEITIGQMSALYATKEGIALMLVQELHTIGTQQIFLHDTLSSCN